MPQWKAATLEELRTLEKNGTWTLIDLPSGKCTIVCKWFLNNIKHMEVLRGLRRALWQRGLLNPMGLIIKKLSPLLPN